MSTNAILFLTSMSFWYITGCLSFAHWWTRDFKFTRRDIPLMLFAGTIGPFSFLVGWSIHGRK